MIGDQGQDRRLLVVGAGGHGKVVIDLARACGWDPIGVLDSIGPGHACLGVPVVGTDDDAAGLFNSGLRFVVVAIGQNMLRTKIAEKMVSYGFECPALIHPAAVVSAHAYIGNGAVVMANAVVNAVATIGRFAIINTGAIVEHDCVIGYGTHVGPRAVMGGGTSIGDHTLFGIGSVARPGSIIGANAIVGAGSVVVKAVASGTVVMGSPARPKNQDRE